MASIYDLSTPTPGSWDQMMVSGGVPGTDPLYDLSKPNPFVPPSEGVGAEFGGRGIDYRNPLGYTSWGEAGGFGKYLGANAGLFATGANVISGLVGAYTGLKGLSLAEDQFKQQKKAFNINLANQTQSYNTQVGDRVAGRHYGSEAERQAALDAALLTDRSSYAKKEEDKKKGG